MKWRHWAILIVLLLLNYIVFSTAFTQLAEQRRPPPRPTRTLAPTFETIAPKPIAWIVLPTSTPRPTRSPVTPTTAKSDLASPEMTPTAQDIAAITLSPSEIPPTATAQPAATATPTPRLPTATPTPRPPTSTPTVEPVVHTVEDGETLSRIAQNYGVTVEAIMEANGLTDPDRIIAGQTLIIPVPGGSPLAATSAPQPTNTPKPKPPASTPAQKPPTATPTPAVSGPQFTATLEWNPLVAPNCAGPAISKESVIRDTSGNPINGVRVQVNCYGNVWESRPSGTPGEYEPGHYDFAFGQTVPQDWTCTARVLDIDGQPVASSEEITIHFDTNDCRPNGIGHQVAILHWIKHW
jgi:LysM repeat protein